MSKLKFLTLMLFLNASVILHAQTQKGYVKTIGRPNKKGVALSGVVVRVKGEHNPVLSKANGTFSMLMTGKKNGDAFMLQEVKKQGYELNENSVIGRQYAYSSKVPLTIVMVSSAQLQSDKQRIENNAYKVAERNYKVKLQRLEAQKKENLINEERYRNELLDLQKKFEKYQLLINGLAEHYAHVDYDALNEQEREINICIENGELERADSLIKMLFDPIDVLKRNKDALVRLNQQISEANAIIDRANEDMAAVLRQQEKDANYLYNLYTIALSRLDNEKAGQYIDTRAELDTTNVFWQIDAGKFFSNYLVDYNRAIQLLDRAKRNTKDSNNLAYIESLIAKTYADKGENDNAIQHYYNSIRIWDEVFSDNKYDSLNESEDSWVKLYFIASHLSEQICANNTISSIDKNRILDCYESMESMFFHLQADSEYGIQFALMRIDLSYPRNNLPDEIKEYIESPYGTYYNNDVEDTQTYYLLLINHLIKEYGVMSLKVADTYAKAAPFMDSPKVYYDRALTIYKSLLGENHPKTLVCHKSVGYYLIKEGKYESAKNYINNVTLPLARSIYSVDDPFFETLYENLGYCYEELGIYDDAVFSYKRCLQIMDKEKELDPIFMANIYKRIAHLQLEVKDTINSVPYIKRALDIYTEQEDANDYTEEIWELYDMVFVTGEADKILSEYVVTIYFDDYTFNKNQRLSGEYVLLKFADWNIKSNSSIKEKDEELNGLSKDMILVKGGKIIQLSYNKRINGIIGLRKVNLEQKSVLTNEFMKWQELKQ